MKLLEIKQENEVLEVHINANGYFLRFGGRLPDGRENMYEMTLSEEDKNQLLGVIK